MEDFGDRLERIRTDVGMSQTSLAKRAGTSQSAISQMERGDRKPSFSMLRKLTEALGVSVAHLLGGDIEGLDSEEEQAHFRQYRSLPDDAKEELRHFAEYLREKHEGE